MNILEISKSSSAKTEYSFFSVFFSSVFGFFGFLNTDVAVGFGFFKISRYRFRFSVTDSALVCSFALEFFALGSLLIYYCSGLPVSGFELFTNVEIS